MISHTSRIDRLQHLVVDIPCTTKYTKIIFLSKFTSSFFHSILRPVGLQLSLIQSHAVRSVGVLQLLRHDRLPRGHFYSGLFLSTGLVFLSESDNNRIFFGYGSENKKGRRKITLIITICTSVYSNSYLSPSPENPPSE